MPNYNRAQVTCYCGKQHVVGVTSPVKCSCGIELHVQQKRGGGKAWGRLKGGKSRAKYLARYGTSKLDAQWLD